MSRRPGIGIPFLQKYWAQLLRDDSTVINNVEVGLPTAYKVKIKEIKDKLTKKEYPEYNETWEKITKNKLTRQEINDKNKIEDHFEEHAYFKQVDRYTKAKFEFFDRSIL